MRRESAMAASSISMLALLLLMSAVTPGLSTESEGSLDYTPAAFIVAMREVSRALECFGDTVHEGLRQQRQGNDVLADLHTLPATVLRVEERINQLDGKIESQKEKMEDKAKAEALAQEIKDLKYQLHNKSQTIHDLQDKHERETNEIEQSSKKVSDLQILLESSTSENQRNLDKLGVLLVELETKSREREHNLEQVQDLGRKLDESRRHAEKLELLVQQLNSTLESKKKDLHGCAEQPPQKIKNLVQAFSVSGDWPTLKRGLDAELDHSSLAHGELERIAEDSVEPLWDIGYTGYTQLATLFLCSGLPVDLTDRDHITMLYGAARGGHHQLVKTLVSRGADVNMRSSYGDTPLTMAAPKGHLEVVRILVQAGADITATDKQGHNALYWATKNGQSAVRQYLEQFPA